MARILSSYAAGGSFLWPASKTDGQPVAPPDVPDHAHRDARDDQCELIGQPPIAVGGLLLGHGRRLPLEFEQRLVGHPWPPA